MSETNSAGSAITALNPRPPFDVDVLRALETLEGIVTDMRAEDVAVLRTRALVHDEAALTLDGEFELTRHETTGVDKNPVEIVLLRPSNRTIPLPVIYHVHGGGLVLGSAYDVLPQMAKLASRVGAAVASIEYRLAPEHQYPAAVEDVYAGLVWLSSQADTLDLDPARIIIEGVSAGGGLAAAAALLARDRRGPHLLGQMLICPMLDERNGSDSGRQMAGVGTWDRAANETGWSLYLGDGPRHNVPIYASPALAENLSGLPPTFIDVGSAETFRDEDVAYASTIWACGGDAELHVWPGGAHSFDAFAPDAAISHDAREARVRWLTRLLSRSLS